MLWFTNKANDTNEYGQIQKIISIIISVKNKIDILLRSLLWYSVEWCLVKTFLNKVKNGQKVTFSEIGVFQKPEKL